MTQELGIRVRALVNDLFSWDQPRALIVTDEVTCLLVRAKDTNRVTTPWDKMDGTTFTKLVKQALRILRFANPSLFL